MNDDRGTLHATKDQESERLLERLFARARPRPAPPEKDAEEIRRAVYEAWDAATGRRMFVRRAGFAAAASIVLALGLWLGFGPGSDGPIAVMASVERVDGLVIGADGEPLIVGGSVAVGEEIETSTGQIGLRLASGGSLRIGMQSRVELAAADSAELLAGELYFDSEGERAGAPFTVSTRLGSVRDIGTQFLARLDGAAGRFDVGVRDGRVELMSGSDTGEASVGERLTVTQETAGIRRDSIATFGSDWDWTERVAPPFAIDGRTVEELLAWFIAQTGRAVVFETPAAEQLARDTVLRGAIDLAPMAKLQAALATTKLAYALEGDRIVIAAR
jgi:ferric-dicitrate binding protein FerR (iron transport regulator)